MHGFRVSQAVLLVVLLAAAAPAIAQSTTSSRSGSRGSSTPSIGQANPGTVDISRPVDPNQTRNLPGAPVSGSITPQTQSLGTNGVTNSPLAPNSNGIGQTLPATSTRAPTLGTGTSGAIGTPATTTTPGTTTASGAATSSSSTASSGGATGRNMPECMSAWDKATHISKPRWREICARTLTEPHI
jgi:hypothetical protein